MILRCTLCHRTGLDVESRIVADESPLGYHREPRCIDETACDERVAEKRHRHGFLTQTKLRIGDS